MRTSKLDHSNSHASEASSVLALMTLLSLLAEIYQLRDWTIRLDLRNPTTPTRIRWRGVGR